MEYQIGFHPVLISHNRCEDDILHVLFLNNEQRRISLCSFLFSHRFELLSAINTTL